MRNNHVVIAYNTCWYVFNFRLPLIHALIKGGWDVTVLAPRDRYTERVVESGARHRHIAMEPRGTNPVREIATVWRFKNAYRELSPGVCLQFTIKPDLYGSIAARSVGIPVVNTITGLGTMFSGGPRELVARAVYRYAFARADLTLFQNPDDHAMFLGLGLVDEERSGLLPGSGVDSERFSPRPRGEGPFTFLLAARLLKAKGVEDFINAARFVRSHHADARFILAGSHEAADPDYVDSRLLRDAQRDGTVVNVGHVDDIRPLMASSDCVVLPSYYREGVPRSLLEGGSMGKPLIAADSVGTREPVRDGENGFLCRARDPGDLASKMELMITMSAGRREAMGSASRAYMIERFDERMVITTYLDAVTKLAKDAT